MLGFQRSEMCLNLLLSRRKVILLIFLLLLPHANATSITCDPSDYLSCASYPSTPNCYLGTCEGSCSSNPSYCYTVFAPLCDTGGTCTPCNGDGDCTPLFPSTTCRPGPLGNNICAQCITNNDCTSALTPECSPSYSCTVCSGDSSCGGSRFPTLPRCDISPGTGKCVECLTSTDCPTAGLPVCSSLKTCTGCSGDGDCNPKFSAKPVCDTGSSECVECVNHSDCTNAAAPVCNSGVCIGCSSSSDCDIARFPTQQICDSTGTHACVECLGNTDCSNPLSPVCSSGVCVGCSAPSECVGRFSGKDVCDTTSGTPGICVECAGHSDCPSDTSPACIGNVCSACIDDTSCGGTRFPALPKCYVSPGPGNCVECLASTDCLTPELAVCTSRTCVGCGNDNQCNTRTFGHPFCDTGSGECIECRNSNDCTNAATPVCNLGVCVGCSSSSDCDIARFPTQQICDSTGTHACVECLVNNDCSDPLSPVCSSGVCVGCSATSECVGRFSGKDVCDTTSGTPGKCVECAGHSDCPSDTSPACIGNVCSACVDDTSCGGTRFPTLPKCDVSPGPGNCVECLANTDCPTPALAVCTSRVCDVCGNDNQCNTRTFGHPFCDTGSGECIECQNSNHCTHTATPVCLTGTCIGCSFNTDCDPKFSVERYCDSTGTQECVECLIDTDCLDPALPICTAGVCTVGCATSPECIRFTGFTECNPISGECVECHNSNTQCTSTMLSTCISDVCSGCIDDSGCSHMTGVNTKCATGGVCGECKDNSICTNFATSECAITTITSACGPCTGNGGCSHLPNNKFCRSGFCGECDTNTDCTNLANPRCETGTSVSTCETCQAHSDCNHVGKLGCVLGVCYTCGLDDHCPLTTNAHCDSSSGYTCQPCSDDTHCAHLAPAKYCAVDTVCKTLKAVFSTESFDRVTPQRRISYTLNVDTYPAAEALTYTWTVSETGITIRTNTRQQIQLRNFETMSPMPTSITFTYMIKNSLGNTDTITRVRNINHVPFGGTLTVSPPTGEALSTVFTLTTTGWTDPDGDTISYKFYYAVNSKKNYIALASLSNANTYTTTLPPGLLEDNYVVYIKVIAQDPYQIEGTAEVTTSVTTPVMTVSQVLTGLQTIVGSTPTQATSSAVLVATYLEQVENELTNSPLSVCPICSYHGTCTSGACVCNSGYTGPGCSLTQAEYNDHISLKSLLLDIMINDYASLSSINTRVTEQSYSIINSVTSSPALVSNAIAVKALTLLNTLTTGIIPATFTIHTDVPYNAARSLENLFSLIRGDCTRSSTFATSLVSSFEGILNSLTTMEIRQRTDPSPYVIETESLYICIQQDIRAEDLKGVTNFMCQSVYIKFPDGGLNAADDSYIDILFVLPKSNYYDCASSTLNLSPYKLYIKSYKTQSSYVTANGDLSVIFPASLNITCQLGYTLTETAEGDLACILPVRADNIEELITGSNIFLLGNIGALADFEILKSLLFYIVVGFSLLMAGVFVWSVHKDKNIDRDVIILPKRSPSKLYRLMVYILISHTFFGIFALFDKNQPRIMRSVLFYIKILGLMAVSTIFNQSAQDLGSLQKNFLSVITLLSVTPINLTVGYLVFKRQLEPKVRRKRLALQSRRIKTPEEKEAEERAKKRAKMLNKCGYSLVVFVVLGYIYVIFVVTANNAKLDNVITRWLQGFVQSWAIDFFGVQIVQVFIHLGIIETLQQEGKKKFLCIPRKHLPKMVNPNIFDYKKRFAALDRLYKEGGINSPNLDNVLEDEPTESTPNESSPVRARLNSILKTAKTRNNTSSATLAEIQLENTMERIELGTRSEVTEITTEQSSPGRRLRMRKNRSQAAMSPLEENSITETLGEGSASPNRRIKRQSNIIPENDQSYDNSGRRDSNEQSSLSPGRRIKRQSNFAEAAQQAYAGETGMDSEQSSPSPSPMRRMRRPKTMKPSDNDQLGGNEEQGENEEPMSGSPGRKIKRNSGLPSTQTNSDANMETVENLNDDRRRMLSRIKTLQGKKLSSQKNTG